MLSRMLFDILEEGDDRTSLWNRIAGITSFVQSHLRFFSVLWNHGVSTNVSSTTRVELWLEIEHPSKGHTIPSTVHAIARMIFDFP